MIRRTGLKVDRVSSAGHRFAVTGGNDTLFGENVVVATGGFNNPRIPTFARELDRLVVQFHSKEYRNPGQIQEGSVLIVGAGNSGAENALELAPRHQTWLSDRDTGQEPTSAGTLPDQLVTPIMWFMATQVLKVTNPLGRKVRDHFLNPPRGIPLGRARPKDFTAAGIGRVARVTGGRCWTGRQTHRRPHRFQAALALFRPPSRFALRFPDPNPQSQIPNPYRVVSPFANA